MRVGHASKLLTQRQAMKAKIDRVLSNAFVIALASMVASVATAAAPTVSQVFFDTSSSPGQVSVVGTNFKPGALCRGPVVAEAVDS
jgi:hypothetical protein